MHVRKQSYRIRRRGAPVAILFGVFLAHGLLPHLSAVETFRPFYEGPRFVLALPTAPIVGVSFRTQPTSVFEATKRDLLQAIAVDLCALQRIESHEYLVKSGVISLFRSHEGRLESDRAPPV